MVRGRFNNGGGGYSLVEIMVIAALIGIFCMVLPPLLRVFLINNASATNTQGVDIRVNGVLEMIKTDLKRAHFFSVRLSNYPNNPPFSKVTFVTVEGSTVTYWQDSSVLYVDRGSGPNKIIDGLRNVYFYYPDLAPDATDERGALSTLWHFSNLIEVSLYMKKPTRSDLFDKKFRTGSSRIRIPQQ